MRLDLFWLAVSKTASTLPSRHSHFCSRCPCIHYIVVIDIILGCISAVTTCCTRSGICPQGCYSHLWKTAFTCQIAALNNYCNSVVISRSSSDELQTQSLTSPVAACLQLPSRSWGGLKCWDASRFQRTDVNMCFKWQVVRFVGFGG